jgi:hypothetical protein
MKKFLILVLSTFSLVPFDAGAQSERRKVFILAGQSNMEGQGSVDHDGERDYNGGKGNLVWSMANSKSADKMKKLKNEKGEWVVRDDVGISFKVGDEVLKGGLTVGYTGYAADGSRRKEPVSRFQTAKFWWPAWSLLHQNGGRNSRGFG